MPQTPFGPVSYTSEEWMDARMAEGYNPVMPNWVEDPVTGLLIQLQPGQTVADITDEHRQRAAAATRRLPPGSVEHVAADGTRYDTTNIGHLDPWTPEFVAALEQIIQGGNPATNPPAWWGFQGGDAASWNQGTTGIPFVNPNLEIPPPTDIGGSIPAPGTPGGDDITPGTGSSPPATENPFQFLPDNFNLPMYEGPYAAPITEGMFDSLQGFRNIMGSNPVMQTQDITNAIMRAASGDRIFDPANGGDINSVLGAYRQDNQYTDALGKMVGRGGRKFNPTNLSGILGQMQNAANFNPANTDLSRFNKAAEQISGNNIQNDFSGFDQTMGGLSGGPDFTDMRGVNNATNNLFNSRDSRGSYGAFDNLFKELAGDSPDLTNLSNVQGDIDRVQRGVPLTNTRGSNNLINSIAKSGANQQPWMRNLTNSFNTALAAPRFDNSAIFKDMEALFEDDLAQQTAELREGFSGLGLGEGASDRLNSIASNAGNARAKFRVGMGDIARQSFENAENRRLGAISQGGMMNDISQTGTRNALSVLPAMMDNERLGFNQRFALNEQILSSLPLEMQARMTPFLQEMAVRDQQANLLPAALERGSRDFTEGMANKSFRSSLLPQMAENAQIPFREQMANRGLMASTLGAQLARGTADAETELAQRGQDISMLPTMLQAAQIPFSENMSEQAMRNSMLPLLADTAQVPFRQEMDFARNVEQPERDQELRAILAGLGIDSEAFDRFRGIEESAADRRMQSIPAMLNARGQDLNAQTTRFDMESALRSMSDQEIMRQMAEFQRTQGGALDQYLKIIGSAPPQSVGIGPSDMSQWGSIIGGLGPLVALIPDLMRLLGKGGKE